MDAVFAFFVILLNTFNAKIEYYIVFIAEWSNWSARQIHTLEVGGSSPPSETNYVLCRLGFSY